MLNKNFHKKIVAGIFQRTRPVLLRYYVSRWRGNNLDEMVGSAQFEFRQMRRKITENHTVIDNLI